MTTINYKNKNYECELVGEIRWTYKVNYSIYVDKFYQRALLVDNNNNAIAEYTILFEFQLESILNKEDKHHEKELNDLGDRLLMEYENWNEFLNNHTY